MSNLPSSITPSSSRLSNRFPTSPPVKTFKLNVTLPTRSINNALTILPGWPDEWRQKEQERKLSFLGRRKWMDEEEDDRDMGERDGEEDVLMDVDSGNEDEDVLSSPVSSVATYPNTVPFQHAPRIPHLRNPIHGLEIPTTSRRSSSFGGHDVPRSSFNRQSLSSIESHVEPPHIQYVTSIPSRSRLRGSSSFRSDSRMGRDSTATSSTSGSYAKSRTLIRNRAVEPRLLVSNNDQTVKMFSLRSVAPLSPRPPSPLDRSDNITRQINSFPSPTTSAIRHTAQLVEEELPRRSYSTAFPRLTNPVPPPRFGSSMGWDSIGLNGGLTQSRRTDVDDTTAGNQALRRELDRAREHIRNEREDLIRQREAFEQIMGIRVGSGRPSALGLSPSPVGDSGNQCPPSPPSGKDNGKEERRLAKVGGARFKYPINHCEYTR